MFRNKSWIAWISLLNYKCFSQTITVEQRWHDEKVQFYSTDILSSPLLPFPTDGAKNVVLVFKTKQFKSNENLASSFNKSLHSSYSLETIGLYVQLVNKLDMMSKFSLASCHSLIQVLYNWKRICQILLEVGPPKRLFLCMDRHKKGSFTPQRADKSPNKFRNSLVSFMSLIWILRISVSLNLLPQLKDGQFYKTWVST